MRRGAVLAAAAVLAFPAGGTARTLAAPLFAFGRVGGNIQPYTVTIRKDGTLAAAGPVQLADPGKQLPAARLTALLRLARTERFWALPPRTSCRDSLPDFASLTVTVYTGSTPRTVRVRGTCKPRFTRLYRALQSAAGVTQ